VEEAAAVAALKQQTLGKYEVIASLGQGGMATVYLALVAGPAGFNKLLVLKILRDDVIAGMEEGVNMFLDEARLSARLVHPNIVHTYEVGEHEGRYFIAMEYLDGQSYRAVQRRARAIGGIPIHEELRIIWETAAGLHYSHTLKGYNDEPMGVVHRDVSPQNVFITYDGQVKLLDFGIAKTSDAEHMTQVGVIKGKLDYIAPEQLRGDPLDGRADVFALGAMLWEAVTGKRFAGGRKVTDVTKVHVRISGGEPNVRTVQPDIPEPLAQIIDRAVALKPQDRWPDAGAFADALDSYVQSTGQKPGARTLAAFVTPLFEEERLKMRKLVEQQVEKVKLRGPQRSGDTSMSLPRIRLGEDSTSGVFVGGQDALTVSQDASRRSLAPLMESTRARARQKSRNRIIVVGAAACAAVVGALFFARSPEAKSIAPSATTSPQAQAPGAQQAPEPAPSGASAAPPNAMPESTSATLVSLTVKVTPTDAHVSLDGAPISAPFTGQFRKDASLHHLEVSGPGLRSVKQLISFDRDQTLTIALEPLPERVAAQPARRTRGNEKPVTQAPTSSAPVKAEEPAPAANPTPAAVGFGEDLKTARPRVSRGHIDSTDPYSNK
jgi:serine/threonine-protein kinase